MRHARARLHAVATAAGASLLVAPVVIGVAYSSAAALGVVGAGADGVSLAAVERVLNSSETWRGASWTVATAGASTCLAMGLAVVVALRVRRGAIGRALAVLPIGVPHVGAALAALLMFSQSGLLSRITRAVGATASPADFPPLVYDPLGVAVVLAGAWKELPYLFLTALAVLLTDTAQLEEVARTLGASPSQVFRRVTWPRLRRGLAPAGLAAFAFLVGQYEIPALLAPSDPTALPLLIYERSVDSTLSRRADAHVLALLALGVSASVVALHAWRQRPEEGPKG